MATKNKPQNEETGAPVIDPNAWQKQDTIDEATVQEGEWVSPAIGTVLEGVLERAFAMKGDDDDFRACYAIRDSNGDVWLFGERVSFKRAIRELKLTTPIRIEFTAKVDLLNAKQKPSGKTAWRVDFRAQPSAALPGAELVRAALKASYAAQANSNDLPF